MPSFYNFPTALKIYTAIASAGSAGLDLEQLQLLLVSPKKRGALMAINTIRIYCRWLYAQQSIKILEMNGNSKNRAVKNLYIAIAPPVPKPSEEERLREIIKILEPYSSSPKSWNKTFKANVINAIKNAIKKAI